MGRRRQVRVAHAEVDDVGAGVARDRLGAVDLLEHVGRQALDAMKFFHRPRLLQPACPAGRNSTSDPVPRCLRAGRRPQRRAFITGCGSRQCPPWPARQPVRPRASSVRCRSGRCWRALGPVMHRRIGRRRLRPLRRILRQATDGRRHVVADGRRTAVQRDSSRQQQSLRQERAVAARAGASLINIKFVPDFAAPSEARLAGQRPVSPGRAKSLSVQAIAGSLWHNMTKARLSGPRTGDRRSPGVLRLSRARVHVMKSSRPGRKRCSKTLQTEART